MITFQNPKSTDDLLVSSALAEAYFKTENDPNQLQVSETTRAGIIKWCPKTVSQIFDDQKVVGFTFGWPCAESDLRKFINGNINEQQLFDASCMNVQPQQADAFYLCSAFLLPQYRKQGLAVQSFTRTLQEFPTCTVLGYWAFTPEGSTLAERIANGTQKPLLTRTL